MSRPTQIKPEGLRERKRRETEAHILSQAIESFRKQGIRAANLGEIASASRVSQATLFNYFSNKGELAEAWVRGEIDRALVRATPQLSGRGLRSALRILCGQVAELVSERTDHAIRLEAWREAGRLGSKALDPAHPLVETIRRWQESERVRADVDAAAIAEMLMEAIEGGLIAALRQELGAAELTNVLRSRVDLILDGARKRNERVIAPSAARGG